MPGKEKEPRLFVDKWSFLIYVIGVGVLPFYKLTQSSHFMDEDSRPETESSEANVKANP